MAFDSKFALAPLEARSLAEWEKQLPIPARTLLHHASQGDLDLYIRRPLRAPEWALTRLHAEAAPLSAGEYVWFPKDEIVGFVPETSTLFTLIAGQRVELDSFTTVISRNLGWDKARGLILATVGHVFQPTGWEIRAFGLGETSAASELAELRDILVTGTFDERVQRLRFNIQPNDISISQAEILAFIARLQSYEFISDLYSNGKVVEALPTYVSGKLSEVIEANHVIWRNFENLSLEERERKRKATLDYLNEDFRSLCKKGSSADGLAKFAAEACDPTLVANVDKCGSHVTPNILAMLTAAKLFWSPNYVDHEAPDTHPARAQVEALLRFMGIKTTNASSSAATIVRPEKA